MRLLLALPGLFLRVQIPDPLLDGVELADLADGHVGLAHLRAFPLRRCRLARLDELAPRVIPAANAGETLLPAHLVVAGIAVGLQGTLEAVEQP